MAQLIGETVGTLRRGALHVELFRATALAALVTRSAAAHGGVADLAQVRARVPLSRRSDARRSDSHAAAVTRSPHYPDAATPDVATRTRPPSRAALRARSLPTRRRMPSFTLRPLPSPSTSPARTSSPACSQAQPADTETDAFIHPHADTLPLDESGADEVRRDAAGCTHGAA